MAAPLAEEIVTRRKKLLDAIERPIDPVVAPAQYKLALLLATFVMVLLPLVYVGLACAFAWVVYFHATHSVSVFNHVRGRGVILALIIYLGPLIAGVTAVLFMFKPLFSRAPKGDKPTSLSRDDEPMLFDFIDKLCDTVHAPRPKRIDVDCQVNASASFRRGWLSMLLGNDLVLTIGLPLVAGMSVRQLGGILAHEFGHFSQGGGMRLTYVIRTVSHWFTRVVYERDTWDINLERWSKENDIRIGVIFYLARGCVWLTRRVLWVLMMIGHGVSGLLLRQMEFDADRHEVRFSGSDTIEPTTRRLHELMVAHEMAFSDLSLAYQEGRLADDITQLVSVNADDLPDKVAEYIDERISKGKTGWLDTHPCDHERIQSGLREAAPGVFHLEQPANELFVNFGDVCRRASIAAYRSLLGSEFHEDQLHSAEHVVAARREQKATADALSSYFQDGWIPLQKSIIAFDVLPTDVDPSDDEATNLESQRRELLELAPQQTKIVESILKADSDLSEIGRASLLLDSGFTVPVDTFSRNLTTKSSVTQASQSVNDNWTAAEQSYSKYQELGEKRLSRTLSLLKSDAVTCGIPEAPQLADECDRKLLPAFRVMMDIFPKIMDLRSDTERFMMCLHLLQNGNEAEGLYNETKKSMSELRDQIHRLQVATDKTPYPFEHLDADMTLAKFLCAKIPPSEAAGEIYGASSGVVDSFFQLYQRVMGRLCWIGQRVEQHFGLEPFPLPQKDESEQTNDA